MAKRGTPSRKIGRRATPAGPRTQPASPHARSRPAPPPPARPITGRVLAVLLGALFVAAVLVIAVKAFGAAGHPLLGLLVGIACLGASALIYVRSAKKGGG